MRRPVIRSFLLVLSFLSVLDLCHFSNTKPPTVATSNRLIRGFHEKTRNGKVYSAFEGIRYARPPLGDLRFNAPQEPRNWNGILNANTKHACQVFLNNEEIPGIKMTEDCLRLNVYVPKTYPSRRDNFDVIVHIHGGAFMFGHPHHLFGPKRLMEANVIFVSISYRLGPLGFLSTEDDVIPGNNGLKDQCMALKWIQRNIKRFGGNPNSVTITGMSAGGASVHLHYMSPLSRGLFQRGYSGSGTALEPWVLQEAALEKAKRLATLAGCNGVTSRDILNCLKRVSFRTLYGATQRFMVHTMPFSPFGLVIEYSHQGAFIDKHPFEILTKGFIRDLPWMVGITTDEGVFPAAFFYYDIEMVDKDWLSFAPHLLDYNYTAPESQRNLISRTIRKEYFGDGPITYHNLVKLCSDRHFYRGPENSINLQTKISKSPIYFMLFAYRGEYSLTQIFGAPDTEKTVSHGDDTIYYLSSTVFGELNKDDEKVKNIFVKMITSFANDSVPQVDGLDWKPTSAGKLDYFYFDGYKNLKMRKGFNFGSIEFWRSLGLRELP